MAKDPAFLFYPNDWLGGTMTLSRHQKGCYLDLLVAQFNSGPLSLDAIQAVLGQDREVWQVLSNKFKQTTDGLWYNERLVIEKEKRKSHSEHQSKNALMRWHKNGIGIGNAVAMPLENENRNENKDKNVLENRGVGKETFCRIEDCLRVALADPRWVKANKTNQDELKLFNEYLERLGKYEFNPLEYKEYFAKLKGRYPDMLKKEYTIDELKEMAKELDKQTLKAV